MASLNKAMLIGNLGRDPDVKQTQNGDKVATLAIATSSSWTDKSGQKQETTEWHRVVFFGRQAEICQQYLKKGSSVYVEGKITTKKWTDPAGVERYSTEITGSNLTMLGSKNDNQSSTGANQNSYAQASGGMATQAPSGRYEQSNINDDIPF
jgi:single-strand DNA-binding protein